MTKVVLARVNDFSQGSIRKVVFEALDKLNYDLTHGADLVIIKPNLCYYWDYSTGETTNPRVVSAVIDWIRQKVGEDADIVVAEADASAMRTKYAFKMLGYEKLSLEKKVKLCNLSEGEIVRKEVDVDGRKLVLPVNRILMDTDLIINVPKMKFHRTLGFTCALKNMFGAIAAPRKYDYHGELAQVIVGINKIISTDIVLVDGLVALGKTPKRMGVIIASDNALAADFAVAKATGCKASSVSYLKLAKNEKVGDEKDVNLIENPTGLEDVKRNFPRQNYLFHKLSWTLQLKMLNLYSKISQDVIPPILEDTG